MNAQPHALMESLLSLAVLNAKAKQTIFVKPTQQESQPQSIESTLHQLSHEATLRDLFNSDHCLSYQSQLLFGHFNGEEVVFAIPLQLLKAKTDDLFIKMRLQFHERSSGKVIRMDTFHGCLLNNRFQEAHYTHHFGRDDNHSTGQLHGFFEGYISVSVWIAQGEGTVALNPQEIMVLAPIYTPTDKWTELKLTTKPNTQQAA